MTMRYFRRTMSGTPIAWNAPAIACIALIIVGSVAIHEVAARDDLVLSRLYQGARQSKRYQPATHDELSRCEDLFRRTMHAGDHATLAEAWRDFGWEFESLTFQGTTLRIVYEPAGSSRGWGFYVIAPERFPGMVLQCPHAFSDKFTDNLALRMFAEGHFAAAAWNTAHRKTVDVAHVHDHPFNAFTHALIKTHPGAYVAQVHGFDPSKRDSVTGQRADMIISNGDDYPDTWVRKVAILMQSELPTRHVYLFPTQIMELGATTNVQGEVLRQHGSERFLHVELNQDLRVRLVADPRLRRRFLKCLEEVTDE